jgi:3-dehydroquinate synthase
MIEAKFKIQNTDFKASISDMRTPFALLVESKPRAYSVNLRGSDEIAFEWLEEEIKGKLVLIDRNILHNIIGDIDFSQSIVYDVKPTEKKKSIKTVLKIADWLMENNANRGSMVYVIGGGIMQDLGAFACAMVKRGIPWTYVPTTLLSQADSCVGGKTAVNFKNSKNTLALFSAPRSVLIDQDFIKTLPDEDYFSGMGEIARLLITGGEETIRLLEYSLHNIITTRDSFRTSELIRASLTVKASIVEFDEFELDHRRSMNYGHSIGHAIEALSNYRIPHGQGVAVGMMVENELAVAEGFLKQEVCDRLNRILREIITENVWEVLTELKIDDILPYLKNDKKVEGSVLKIAALHDIGDMRFEDFPLNATGVKKIKKAFKRISE